MEIKPIAYISTDFREKFGIPRQGALAAGCTGEIVFEKEFRSAEAVRGLEEFSHIWLLWDFSKAHTGEFSPTVRPPRLGGNTRVGVFASRSPFRPNSIGLSAVRLERIEITPDRGPILYVSGVDLLDGTPIYDIKPYIPYADSIAAATDGYTGETKDYRLNVVFPQELLALISESKRDSLIGILSLDPRTSYNHDPEKVWGMSFRDSNIRFQVCGDTLTVVGVD